MTKVSLKEILTKLLDNKSMIDRFYPVGSYYETSDTTFNPNVSWGGTWSLETEGQVHVSGSASGTYQVSGARTNTSDGGASTVKLTDAQMAHGHGMTQPAFTIAKEALTSGNQSANHSHSVGAGLFWHARTDEQVVNGSAASMVEATGNAFFNSARTSGNNSVNHTHKVPSAAYSVPRSTNAAVTNLHGDSTTRTAHNNMQPYIVVNRWHRTA